MFEKDGNIVDGRRVPKYFRKLRRQLEISTEARHAKEKEKKLKEIKDSIIAKK